jgi:purine-binding chemotaxis protein CheW
MSQAPLPAADEGVLTIKVAGELLALPIARVMEIIRPSPLTRVPLGPPNLLGLANLRSTVLPVFSLAGLLGHQASKPNAATRVVVIEADTRVGLVVDEVSALAGRTDYRLLDIDQLLIGESGLLTRPSSERKVVTAAAMPAPTVEAKDELVYIAFELAKQLYALPLDKVVHISALPEEVAAVPHADAAMLGATSLRGELTPLVSLRVLLGLEGATNSDAKVVVIKIGEIFVGVVVDRISEIVRTTSAYLDAVPPVLTRAVGEAQIEAICRRDGGKRLISILSTSTLFNRDTIERFTAYAGRGSTEMSPSIIEKTEQFVVFQLADELYALPIASVDEVVRSPDKVTRVPRAPGFVEGVMNLRGKAVPLIDQRQRFGVTGKRDDRGRVLVVTVEGVQAGFLVDRVSEVISVPLSELRPAPEFPAADASPLFDRVAVVERLGRMILVVEPRALLDRAERDVISSFGAQEEGRLSQ